MSSVDVKLGRYERIYREGEIVTGVVVVNSSSGISHSGIELVVNGAAPSQRAPLHPRTTCPTPPRSCFRTGTPRHREASAFGSKRRGL